VRLASQRPQLTSRSSAILSQQNRSISWTGWWSSTPSQPATPPADSASLDTTAEYTQVSGPIRASSGTADTPAIFQSVPADEAKPDALEAVEDALLGTNAEHLDNVDLSQIPERIGYLQDVCGLTYWYGPTVTIQTFLEYLHVTGGLPWVAAMGITALLVRTIATRWVIRAQRMSAKMREVTPVLAPLREAYRAATLAGNREQSMRLAGKMRQIHKENDLSILDGFKPLLIQIPLSFGGFRCLRNMSDLPVPSMENESFLWVDSLTSNDPYVIPAIIALLTWRTMTLNSRQAALSSTQAMSGVIQALKYVLPLVSFVFCHYQLLAVQLWFLFQTLFTQVQANALQNGGVRRYLQLAKLPDPTAAPVQPEPEVDAFGYRIKPKEGSMSIRGGQAHSEPPQPQPQENVSVIDRGIDRVSSSFWKTDIGKAMEQRAEQGNKAKAVDAKKQTYDDYESRKRRDEQSRRKAEPKLEDGVQITAGMKRRAPRRS
jgi:YidC/Oxa1 family membrane protein insertase